MDGVKVRWSSRCAGGCGAWLPVGSHAVYAHRGYWCPTCWATHAPTCTHTRHPAPRERADEPVQLPLPL